MVFDQVRHRVDTAVDGSRGAEVDALRLRSAFDGGDRAFDQLVHAFVLRRADRHDGDAEFFGEFFDLDGAAVLPHLVHHVESEDGRQSDLQKLEGQIEIPLHVRRIDDVDDPVGVSLQEEVARDDLFVRIRAQGIDPGQVDDRGVRVPAHRTALFVHGNAGEVADVAVRPRQTVEERGLAAVLISDQGEDHAVSPPSSGRTSIFAASSRRRVSS